MCASWSRISVMIDHLPLNCPNKQSLTALLLPPPESCLFESHSIPEVGAQRSHDLRYKRVPSFWGPKADRLVRARRERYHTSGCGSCPACTTMAVSFEMSPAHPR